MHLTHNFMERIEPVLGQALEVMDFSADLYINETKRRMKRLQGRSLERNQSESGLNTPNLSVFPFP